MLLPAAYRNHHLTGAHVADMSDSAGTGWLDLAARDWSLPLLEGTGIRPDQMPRLVEGSAAAGILRGDLAAHWEENVRPPDDVQFAPYLSGERTPHNDAHVRGSLAGISTSTTTQDLTHAVLTGVCFGLPDGFEPMEATGARFGTLYAIDGGVGSRYWLRLLATVLEKALHLPAGGGFGAALGAALLGMVAATGAR